MRIFNNEVSFLYNFEYISMKIDIKETINKTIKRTRKRKCLGSMFGMV